jgi:Protein of unknown function (DUF742)
MTSGGEIWLDREAGPVVRPYALTRGRTRPPGQELGLIDLVAAAGDAGAAIRELGPEQRRLLSLCRTPAAVADLASETDLPLGVVRVLLGDLRERGLVRVVRAAGRTTPEESVLRSVLDGLRAL